MNRTRTSLGSNLYYSSQIRSTKQNVRQYVFTLLNKVILNSAFLDLFAGSGSVGIEALSQHAQNVYFNDICKTHIKRIIRFCNTHCFTNVSFTTYDIYIFFQKNIHIYDIIYIDPPYRMFRYVKYFISQSLRILRPGGIIVLESSIIIPQLGEFFRTKIGISYIYFISPS